MAKAVIDGTVIADSTDTVVVEGNHYFPPGSVNWDFFSETEMTTVCGWKGTASYYNISVGSDTLDNVAWTYHAPMDAALEIKDYVAFYPQIAVEVD